MANDELVAIYSADGAVTGSATRARMRAEGLWHACGAILVRSGDRVHVHRRTDDKDVFPGMHDCWAGGVVAAGETPLECARRELAEELGIDGVPLNPLFTLSVDLEHTRIHLFAYEVFWDGEVVLQDEEIAWGGWMTVAELRARLDDPAWPFVPDGRIAVEEWFRRQS
ncbi:NUDIX hydrolase [Actinokineospora sp. HUAS TT18]|uniref:NUDIX hydrolase n=1 Tax=Actinokineospora sp. HUAS TT18 TaxID=3447451 RepID=UPI003F51F8EC